MGLAHAQGMKNAKQRDALENPKIAGLPAVDAEIALEMTAGAAAGGLVGVLAGPPGAAVGALIGGLVGAAAGLALERGHAEEQQRAQALDRDIGVIGGTIGEPSLKHPPSEHGLFHCATLGVSSPSVEASDGPIQNVDSGEG